MNQALYNKALRVCELLAATGRVLACAESCTGGMLGAYVTAIPGSSAFYTGGIICYSNEVKNAVLGVPSDILSSYGAVSEQCAKKMALGALKLPFANVSVAITGIAGPTGGSEDKPVGLVFIAVASQSGVTVSKNIFQSDRQGTREASVMKAFEMLEELLLSESAYAHNKTAE